MSTTSNLGCCCSADPTRLGLSGPAKVEAKVRHPSSSCGRDDQTSVTERSGAGEDEGQGCCRETLRTALPFLMLKVSPPRSQSHLTPRIHCGGEGGLTEVEHVNTAVTDNGNTRCGVPRLRDD